MLAEPKLLDRLGRVEGEGQGDRSSAASAPT